MTHNGPTAASYPTAEQYARWKSRAAEYGMSVSEFIQSMVEAGIKADEEFETTVAPDESVAELREERNQLQSELQQIRARISTVEETPLEREMLREFLRENPDADFEETVEYMWETLPSRVRKHLDSIDASVDGMRSFSTLWGLS